MLYGRRRVNSPSPLCRTDAIAEVRYIFTCGDGSMVYRPYAESATLDLKFHSMACSLPALRRWEWHTIHRRASHTYPLQTLATVRFPSWLLHCRKTAAPLPHIHVAECKSSIIGLIPAQPCTRSVNGRNPEPDNLAPRSKSNKPSCCPKSQWVLTESQLISARPTPHHRIIFLARSHRRLPEGTLTYIKVFHESMP